MPLNPRTRIDTMCRISSIRLQRIDLWYNIFFSEKKVRYIDSSSSQAHKTSKFAKTRFMGKCEISTYLSHLISLAIMTQVLSHDNRHKNFVAAIAIFIYLLICYMRLTYYYYLYVDAIKRYYQRPMVFSSQYSWHFNHCKLLNLLTA